MHQIRMTPFVTWANLIHRARPKITINQSAVKFTKISCIPYNTNIRPENASIDDAQVNISIYVEPNSDWGEAVEAGSIGPQAHVSYRFRSANHHRGSRWAQEGKGCC
mmetsp:Transcript_11790/g.25117  ORF Transcript_11790/g.25117 Transcript_11790/m.25117 type:complete len:107 (+) Transcript_11790:4810-5130(+)